MEQKKEKKADEEISFKIRLEWAINRFMEACEHSNIKEASLHIKYDESEINIVHSPNGAIDFDK